MSVCLCVCVYYLFLFSLKTYLYFHIIYKKEVTFISGEDLPQGKPGPLTSQAASNVSILYFKLFIN
jgi:hypothetical protein